MAGVHLLARKEPVAPSRLGQNIAALSALQILNYIVPLITVPYLVRVLQPAGFGLLSFAQALVVYFDLVTDYGFNLGATRAIAGCQRDTEALARTFWRTLAAKLVLMLASVAMLAVIVASVPALRQNAPLYAAAFLTVMGTAVLPVWFLQGIERMKPLALAQASARLLTIPALIAFVRTPGDYVRAAVIQGGVPLTAFILLLPALRRLGPRAVCLPRRSEVIETLREGWHLFVANSALVINSTTPTVVLGLVAGTAEVGYYAAADKIIRAVTSLLGPVAQALYPHLAGLRTRSATAAMRVMRSSFSWIGSAALAASVAVFVLAGPAGTLLWGERFARSVFILRCLAPLPFLLALVNLMGVQTMLVFGMDRALSRVLFGCVLVNAALTLALGGWFGAPGAAGAAVIAALLIDVLLAWRLRKDLPRWHSGGSRIIPQEAGD